MTSGGHVPRQRLSYEALSRPTATHALKTLDKVVGRTSSVSWRRASPLLVPALIPMVVLAVLVACLVWMSFIQGIVGTSAMQYTLGNYAALLFDSAFLPVLFNTAVFAICSSALALLIGLPVAWLVERSTLPGKAVVYALMTTGVLIPGIYIAMGWTFVAHPRIGFVNTWLQAAFGSGAPVLDLTSPAGMGLIQGLSFVPLTFILSVQTFRAMNPALEETARIHGLGPWRTARRVTLPLARPGMLAALIYILTIAIATFDIPAVLGMGNRVYVLSTYLYLKSQPLGASAPEYGITAALGTFMILVALGLTVWYAQVLRQAHRFQVISGKGYRPTPVSLGPKAVGFAWGLVLVYVVLAVGLPLLLIAFAAFSPFLQPPSPEAFALLGFTNFQKMDFGLVLRGLRNTLLLVATVPLVVLLLAFCTSWLVVRSRARARYALDFGAFLPHALPEVILAISASLVALFVVARFVPLYGSVWLIAIVYVIGRFAFATRSFNTALLQVHRELEEAALVSGLSMVRTAWRVLLPILRPTVLAVWAWTAVLVYRELTVAVFLVGPSNVTLSAAIWSFWAAGGRNQAAAVTLLMTALLIPLLLLFWWFGRRSEISPEGTPRGIVPTTAGP
jgi:iron(III) transport system permease protein